MLFPPAKILAENVDLVAKLAHHHSETSIIDISLKKQYQNSINEVSAMNMFGGSLILISIDTFHLHRSPQT